MSTEFDVLEAGEIGILGIPLDKNSSFRRGPGLAAPHIRQAFYSDSANLWTELGIDLGSTPGWKFLDDLTLPDDESDFAVIEAACQGAR